MTQATDWPALIGEMILTKNEIIDLDPSYYDDYTLPNERAAESEVTAFEGQLGESLPAEFRSFLLHANGWRMFYWDADLFGLKDVAQGPSHPTVSALLSAYRKDRVLEDAGLAESDVLPIGASPHGQTLFLLVRSGRPEAGQVSWISGEEVDRYADFAEFFASITAYFRAHIEQLRNEG